MSSNTAPAGPLTVSQTGPTAYSIPYPGLEPKQLKRFVAGKEQFHEAWVVAPDPSGVWGLGPTFNEDRCVHCHEGNGRARAPSHGGELERGFLVRLSVPGKSERGGPKPHAVYGLQLQNRGIVDRVPAEGKAFVDYEIQTERFADGEAVELRKPKLRTEQLEFGELEQDVMLSVRSAPQVVGLGLLEAVPEEQIIEIARAQPKQGVSGRANYVWDHESEQTVLGRFGWKASQPSIRQQTASAFFRDIGATTYMFPDENCPQTQRQCLDVPSASKCGGQGGCTGHSYRPEVNPSRLKNITLYLQALMVPDRRNTDSPQVQQGGQLFAKIGCAACHVPELRTGDAAALAVARGVTIRPYTDLLLHDMGDELADGHPEFGASGREWRTAPLWGIGLLADVNGHSDLLHDGRARNVTEAILWHAGEGEAARESFRSMAKEERAALVAFVESL